MPQPDQHAAEVIDLITGRWRSQVLYVGVALGVFDAVKTDGPAEAGRLARDLSAAPETLYRLLRALASIGLLSEGPERSFSLTPSGALLRKDHPGSLRAMALLEEGPVHYATWKHLLDIVRTGEADGFKREFGEAYFRHMQADPAYARVFSEAMSSYSAGEAPAVRRALRDARFDGKTLCDVGGSAGRLLAEVLRDHPDARGIVFDLPEVVAGADPERLAAQGDARLAFEGGDMFASVPAADVYFFKHILHDWDDEDCARFLAVARRAAKPGARMVICEMLVPGPETSHFAKLIDIHMMVVQSGRQRTAAEIGALLERTGWAPRDVQALEGSPLSVLHAEARPDGKERAA